MYTFLELIKKRRSIRKFEDKKIPQEEIKEILKPALLSPSSKSKRPWRFIVTEESEKLDLIAKCKPVGAKFVTDASAAILILGNSEQSDVWIEDCAVATTLIQLAAEEKNIGSTWVQIRKRKNEEGEPAENILKESFDIPESWNVLAVVALGYKQKERSSYSDDDMEWDKVSYEKF